MSRPAKVSTVTPIAAALELDDANAVEWSDSADVVVVGWGAAGACAAIEARATGASVLVIDRFDGGGASTLSGGVVYAGGGTPYQKQAGFNDTPEAMADYLRHEVNGVVSDATLKKFCDDSVANLAWLEMHGARFGATMPDYKTSYPPEGKFLYYSGNEVVPAYKGDKGAPAPRGHRAVAKGQSGATLYAALQAATLRAGAQPAAALQPVPAPLPSSVLLVRPDIQAAENNLRAMEANIGAARAAMFPTISLTASVGSGSRELDGLFGGSSSTWSFIPLVRLPIFDGGRNRAGVQVAEANQRIAIAQYEKAVQTAFRETADVLADRAQWDERLAAQTSMVAATQKAFDLSEARFKAGVDNYLTVLDAQRSLYTAQQTLIGLRLSEQLNRVTLWKVLDGEQVQASSVSAPANS